MGLPLRTYIKSDHTRRCVLKDGPFGHRYYTIVYAVHAPGNRLFKLGRTNNIEKRFNALKTMSPICLELYGHLWMPHDTEAHIHDLLRNHRAHGEWFDDVRQVRDIANLIKANDAWGLAEMAGMDFLSRPSDLMKESA